MKAKVLVTQLCPTLCDPMDCSPPGSSVHGIFQARILEQVAIPFSRGSSQPRDQTQVCSIASNSLSSEPRRNMLRHKLIKLTKIKYKEKDWNQQENFPGGTLNKNLPATQGMWVHRAQIWSPVQEDSTCCGATEPKYHNWAQALEPTSYNKWAFAPRLKPSSSRAHKTQLLSPHTATTEVHVPRVRVHNKKSHLNDKPVHCSTE